MTDRTFIPARLLQYVRDTSLRESDVLRRLREETATLPAGDALRIPPEEGQLLALLIRLSGARKALEVGTFTGYGTLWMASALPADGKILTCDLAAKWPGIGAPHWARAGLEDRIEQHLGDAREYLEQLLATGHRETFDFVFIDADKSNYRNYYRLSFELLRPGGLIVVDNTLLFGRVLDPAESDPETAEVSRLNAELRADDRIDLSLLPVADGVTLVRKKTG
ncbi:class I SAM-dependent methyltransferase [Amycolatopsis sp. NPDC004079]|uniref:O-methyltransferase n=1 Tax=Amycolatopsis sp. NPDC004079 TaxID=3154549 RepID=UPI0033A17B2C